MKAFMDRDFLLSTDTAKRLYRDHAENAPILDYHCHINPQEIAEDRRFENIFQVWLGGDHYKWRQMRINGVPEEYITGNRPEREKFQKWAETLPKLIGNPLYHWSHLELRKYFGYRGYLNGDTAEEVWQLCNEKLRSPSLSVRNLIKASNVRLICTTDDPIDSLEWHKKIAEDPDFEVQVLPAFRPDKVTNIEKEEYPEYLRKLSACSGIEIRDFRSLKEALRRRLDYFQSLGCVVTDHALRYIMFSPASEPELDEIVKKRLRGEKLSAAEAAAYRTGEILFLAREYNKRNMVFQIHFGCIRDNNAAMYERLGADSGFDSVDNYAPADQMAALLNELSRTADIPKTILYSLNPCDNAVINSLCGCFCEAPVKNRVTQGAAWWFNDHKEGMSAQLKDYANLSALGNFNGMLTDSRSFLSYTRHDYFRRILCELLGGWVENGEYPDDERSLSDILRGICFNNAVRYFDFRLSEY